MVLENLQPETLFPALYEKVLTYEHVIYSYLLCICA